MVLRTTSLCVLLGLAFSKQPHILFVLIDDQGYGDIGYTNPLVSNVSTPFIDSLAAEGLVLKRHYAQWSCSPSRASLMAGRYAAALGWEDGNASYNKLDCLKDEIDLLPGVLKKNGYATHLVGKWHLGYAAPTCLPCRRGFDTSYGFLGSEIHYFTHFIGTIPDHKYVDFYQCHRDEDAENGMVLETLEAEQGTFSNDLYTERVRNLTDTHDPDTPLFLYLSMQSIHYPYEVPPKFMPNCHYMITDDLCQVSLTLKTRMFSSFAPLQSYYHIR